MCAYLRVCLLVCVFVCVFVCECLYVCCMCAYVPVCEYVCVSMAAVCVHVCLLSCLLTRRPRLVGWFPHLSRAYDNNGRCPRQKFFWHITGQGSSGFARRSVC